MPRNEKSSGFSAAPNGRGLVIATVISLVTLCAVAVTGALFIVDRANAAERQAVARCESMMEDGRMISNSAYAQSAAVARLEAKVDAISAGVVLIRSDMTALRTETREALSRRRR